MDSNDGPALPPRPSKSQSQEKCPPPSQDLPTYPFSPYDPPPLPPYTLHTTPALIRNQVSDTPRKRLPCVIPQTSHTFHGTIYRPFARAYPPDLTTTTLSYNDLTSMQSPDAFQGPGHPGTGSISATDFLAFIDGLNAVWLAHPYLQTASATSGIFSFVPLLEVQLAALGVAVATEYGSHKLSQMRTEAYLRLANEELFVPRGLRVQILKTRQMMETVGISGEVLKLGRLEGRDEVFPSKEECEKEKEAEAEAEKENELGKDRYDPQMRRMDVLKGYVLPLEFGHEKPPSENWIKRASEKQARLFADRQNSQLVGKRDKATKLVEEAQEAERELNAKVQEIEAAKREARARARERMEGPLGESNTGKLMVQEDLEKELKKLGKKGEKVDKEREKRVTRKLQQSQKSIQRVEKNEERIAQRVMWVVVTEDDGRGENHLWDSDTIVT
ncbi:hypothetical protein EYZ11_009529 [Aspergillus tanneri]|uniref:Uncharacterized protein n=1 Tax=Aspergillus tanneri TaxID=1220188 RepID=A0A4S3JD35_9EURO|nr:hypothetical protein EYZ11_009529 [Aspergillus tanneri]